MPTHRLRRRRELYLLLTFAVPISATPAISADALAVPLTLLVVATVGCLAVLVPAIQRRQWGMSASVLLGVLIPSYTLASLFTAEPVRNPVGFPVGAAIIYGLSVGPYRFLQPRTAAGVGEGARVLLIAALIPFTLNYLHAVIAEWFAIPAWFIVLLAVAAALASEVAAVRGRQWGWVVGVPLLAVLTLMAQLTMLGQLPEDAGLRWTELSVLAPVSLLVAAACYVLWAGPPTRSVVG